MAPVKRWLEWAGGAVKIGLDGHQRYAVTRRDVKWKWLMVAATPLPWCPLCGSIVPPKAHKYKGMTAMKIHEEACWGFEEDEPEQEQLQLEEGNGDVREDEG